MIRDRFARDAACANASGPAPFRKKAHGTAHHSAIERKPHGRHIAGMSAKPNDPAEQEPVKTPSHPPADNPNRPREIGGPKGPEPTRYGDWEVGGRCTDF
jgi:hypothetical protein